MAVYPAACALVLIIALASAVCHVPRRGRVCSALFVVLDTHVHCYRRTPFCVVGVGSLPLPLHSGAHTRYYLLTTRTHTRDISQV